MRNAECGMRIEGTEAGKRRRMDSAIRNPKSAMARRPVRILGILAIIVTSTPAFSEPPPGRLATGNLSVDAIQHSPIGSAPDPAFRPSLPAVENLKVLWEAGLCAYEDYIAWGAVEREEGKYDFSHHDEVAKRMAEAGLPYVTYIWCHVPPAWLRNSDRVTRMRCNAHGQPPNQSPAGHGSGQACNMLSIFDPRTLDWYERFYRALHDHFGDRIALAYACLLGPFGEGNYPLPFASFVVDLGHCHEGYWCGDAYALPAFRKAMGVKYGTVEALNAAWGSHLASLDGIAFPPELAADTQPDFSARPAAERRRWLDFIRWYHQALIDFSGSVIDRVVKIFGRDRVAVKPGGNGGWMNPLPWGTYCPGFAKTVAARKIPAQLADAKGAYWADKWASTAYAFYGGEYRTEAAGSLDDSAFMRRAFSDASCGATRLMTYEVEKHLPACRKVLPYYTGARGRTDIALLAPTTMYYLNADVKISIETGAKLRDVVDYDVLDEQLVLDGALNRYRALVAVDCAVVEAEILRKISAWVGKGGILVWACRKSVEDVEGGTDWPMNQESRRQAAGGSGQKAEGGERIRVVEPKAKAIARAVAGAVGPLIDGEFDSVWSTDFGDHLMLINLGAQTVDKNLTWKGRSRGVRLPSSEIIEITPDSK